MYYEKFAYLCEKTSTTPAQVSKATGISRTTFTDWKQDRYTPKVDKLKLIADFFNVELSYFTEEEQLNPDTVLINAYQKASPEIQLAVRKLLDIREKEDSGYSRKAE